MMYPKAGLAVTLTAMVVGGGTGDAIAAAEYKIDPVHSAVSFKVKHHDVSYVCGRFNKISGVIRMERPRGQFVFDINVEIASKRLDTNDQKRDRHLRGTDFFNVKKHPKITFKGKTVKQLEDNKFELAGKLAFLGVEKDLTVVFELIGRKEVSRLERRIGGESTFTIKRSEYGMEEAIPEVADEVTVIVNIEAFREVKPAG